MNCKHERIEVGSDGHHYFDGFEPGDNIRSFLVCVDCGKEIDDEKAELRENGIETVPVLRK